MTSNPEWCPTDIWTDAVEAAKWADALYVDDLSQGEKSEVVEAIAAAILRQRERAAQICECHIEVVASRGRRWLERHEILNEETHSGFSYARAIRGDDGAIRTDGVL